MKLLHKYSSVKAVVPALGMFGLSKRRRCKTYLPAQKGEIPKWQC